MMISKSDSCTEYQIGYLTLCFAKKGKIVLSFVILSSLLFIPNNKRANKRK